ncbi:MAG: type IVB secretion system protein IcmH/DotU [Polyangiaceae bacterium]
MTQAMFWACADVLILGAQLPRAANLPPPAELRQRILTALDAMVGKGRSAGLPDGELVEARYALVAFIDEQILKSNWPGRAEWMGQPLQLQLYGEYTAGENFFNRLRSLLQQGGGALAIEIYYLCLALGFRGSYGHSNDQRPLTQFSDAARERVMRGLPNAGKLGPHAEPHERMGAARTSNAPLIGLIVGCIFVGLLVVFGLERLLHMRLQETLQALPASSARVGS